MTRDPHGRVGASAAGAADDRLTQRRSAGRGGDLDRHDAGWHRGQPDPRRGVMRGTMRTLRDEHARRAWRTRSAASPPAWRRRSTCRSTSRIPRGNTVTVNSAAERDLAADAVDRRGSAAAPRPAAGDDGRGFRLVPGKSVPAHLSGSATARPRTAASCTTPVTTTTTLSCRPPPDSLRASRSVR